MTEWLGSLWFAPSGLVEYTRKGRALNGIYVPYWTFDADTASRYRGQRGVYYYETQTVTVKSTGGASSASSRSGAPAGSPSRARSRGASTMCS